MKGLLDDDRGSTDVEAIRAWASGATRRVAGP